MTSGLDFNKPRDFARATGGLVSAGAGLLQLFGLDPALWDVEEGSFRGVLFHVFKSRTSYQAGLASIVDEGGRRKAKLVFPYKDGQTTDDLGRAAESFQVIAVLHGPSYKDNLQALLDAIQDPSPADLVHPVRGLLRCVCERFRLTHSHEHRQAVAIELTFAEHNFTYSDFAKLSDDFNFRSILTAAAKAFGVAEQLVNKVQAATSFVTSVRAQLVAVTAAYRDAFGKAVVRVNTDLSKNGGGTDLPAIKPVKNGGLRASDGSLTKTTYPTAISPNDPFATSTLPTNAAGTAEQLGATSPAVAAIAVQNSVLEARAAATAAIAALASANPALSVLPIDGVEGPGALLFYDDIQSIRQAMILLQDAFERGVQSSRAAVVRFVVPRLMSVREVAFANGLTPDRSNEIALLNPELRSLNFIDKGEIVLVPT